MAPSVFTFKAFLAFALLAVILQVTASTNTKPKLSKHGVLIVLSFDGFRHDYIGRVPTPNILRVASKGIRAPMTNQFPTKTFPNHFSIATGLHPESHGVIDNSNVFDPLLGRVISGYTQKEFFTYRDDVFPIWVLNEWAGDERASGVCMWPGGKFPYGANQTMPTYLQTFNESVTFETRVDLLIDWITNDTKPANLVMTYFSEPDETAHAFGPETPQVDEQIKRMDNLTGYLVQRLEALGIYDDVNLVLLSDHGFHEVRIKDFVNITEILSPGQFGYKVYGGTPIFGIVPNDAANQADIDNIYNTLKEATVGKNFSVYKKSEVDKEKPNWHFQNNRRIMPIIVVADPGYTFEDFQMWSIDNYAKPPHNHTYDPLTSTYGIHGYDNAHPSMHPYFIAHGPLFPNNGQNASSSFVNIDLFPLFCKILGFDAPPNNGTDSAIRLVLSGGGVGGVGSHGMDSTEATKGSRLGNIIIAVFGIIFLVLAFIFAFIDNKFQSI